MTRNKTNAMMLGRKAIWRAVWLMAIACVSAGYAASSALITQSAGSDFAKGKIDRVVIDSNGTIRLAYRADELDVRAAFKDVWAVYCALAASPQVVYVGTGPNGAVFKVSDEGVQTVWPLPQGSDAAAPSDSLPRNEHIFALAKDVADRLLVAVSGQKGYLVRLDPAPATVFEHPDVQYIFAIAIGADHSIFLATGPKGHLFKLDPFCQNPEIIYTVPEKNILSLALDGATVYAGTDQKGIIYKIDSAAKTASVVYDADQTDIQALLVDEGGALYAAAASLQSADAQPRAGLMMLAKPAGRPDSAAEGALPAAPTTLNAPAGERAATDAGQQRAAPAPPPAPAPKGASQIYRVDQNGFVQSVFAENVVFYAMSRFDNKIWLATGNNGRLFSFDPTTDEKSIAYEDTLSSQMSALSAAGDVLYAGLSNPARLIRLTRQFNPEGVYESPLLDAGQPALWGKIQLDASLPAGCAVIVSCRSGNVNDLASPTLSAWTNPVALNGAVDLACPVGRFMQYRLTLSTQDTAQTPIIRKVVVSHTVPNLPPQVTAVRAVRSKDKAKPGIFEVSWDAQDPNRDDLTYKVEFRRLGRRGWILLKDQLTQPRLDWDSRTVEDGRYELRVIADDSKSNSPSEALSASRVSDIVAVDNTPPAIENIQIEKRPGGATVRLMAVDALSAISRLSWTVNSNDQWTSVLPVDRVYDTPAEAFLLDISGLSDGENVLAIMASDEAGNAAIRTVLIE